MQILFDARIHLNYMTGIGKYIISLLEQLFSVDNNVNYIILVNSKLHSKNPLILLVNKTKNASLMISKIPYMGPLNLLLMPFLIQKINPDIYHYPHLDAPISKIPTVATIHDAATLCNIKKYSDVFGIKSSYIKYTLKRTLKNAAKIIFVSHTTMNDIYKHSSTVLSKDTCEVVYNGIDQNYNNISEKDVSKVKKKYNLPENYFLYVGVLRSHKNIKRILEAYNELKIKNISLVIVGKKYEQYDFNSDGILYLENISDIELKVIYKLALCLVYPSLFEGFGLPILEAMKMGVPVITSNFGATKEIGGDAAIYTNPYSVKDIAEKMTFVIQEKNIIKTYISKGFKRAKEFSWSQNAFKTLAIYKKLYKKRL